MNGVPKMIVSSFFMEIKSLDVTTDFASPNFGLLSAAAAFRSSGFPQLVFRDGWLSRQQASPAAALRINEFH